MATLEDFKNNFNLSHYVIETVNHLLSEEVTKEQFNSRRYRARQAKKYGLVLDMAIAYEIYHMIKLSE